MSRVQSIDARAQAAAHLDQPEHERQQIESPYLTTAEACVYLRYVGKHRLRTLYRFIATNGIRTQRRGQRRLLIARRDLDKAIGARRS